MIELQHPSNIVPADYWIVDAAGVEWFYVMKKLIEPIAENKKATDNPVIIVSLADTEAIRFYMKKKYFPIEVLVKATGLPEPKLTTMPVIVLRVKPTDLPEPTVIGWGTA